MKWTYRLLRVAGIDIRVHATFALALLLGAANFGGAYGAPGAFFGVCLVMSVFVCVTLHELGHSLVAQRFGATVREIVLLPIGGVARLVREPSRPLHELLVAVAGPMVNVVLAVILFFALGLDLLRVLDVSYLKSAVLEPLLEPPTVRDLPQWLLVANVSLAVFNMIPAFPMDGGRVLRAALCFPLGRSRATAVATRVGQLLAVALILLALFEFEPANPMLALIGLFVFLGASQEKAIARASDVLEDLVAGDLCNQSAVALGPRDDLGDVVDHALRTGQQTFPVVYGTELIGVVLRDEALEAAVRHGLRTSVRQVLRRRNLAVADASTPLMELRERIADAGSPVIVTEQGRFIGVLGSEDLARIFTLASRLSAAGIRRPRAPLAAPEEVSATRSPPAAGG